MTSIPSFKKDGWGSFWWLNVWAAILHAVHFTLMMVLHFSIDPPKDLVYPLFETYSTWAFGGLPKQNSTANDCVRPKGVAFGPEMEVTPAFVDTGITLSLHWVMATFFALSATFQGGAALLDWAGWYPYYENVTKFGTHWLRFVEYSISASVMIMGIALQIGIMDVWMHVALFSLSWITMMCGLIAEQLMGVAIDIGQENPKLIGLDVVRWVVHIMGWVPQIVIYTILLTYFYKSQNTCEFPNTENVAPDFVYAIIYTEMILFSGFAVTQIVQFVRFDIGLKGGHEAIEASYIVQSMVSKFVLGWLIYGGNFAA